MERSSTSDKRVTEFEPLPEPRHIVDELPLTKAGTAAVHGWREALQRAIHGSDPRLVVIAGPCSIHDPDAALEYASKLRGVIEEVSDALIVVMRVYFEKPRTTVGWKGLINDPDLNGTQDIHRGLRKARSILLGITEIGVPCATELLDPIVPQYISDLVSWAAIGARTTESQTHREMASGLSMPVGFKNSTDGALQVAIDAMESSRRAHAFLGVAPDGRTSVVRTAGNEDVHLVLRGGRAGPNFSRADLAFGRVKLEEAGIGGRRMLVDCSHGNSKKDFHKQADVFRHVLKMVQRQEPNLLGAMLESNLVEGNQKLGPSLEYGRSITDACIGWDETAALLREAHRTCSASAR